MTEQINKMFEKERQDYCLWCIHYTREGYDHNEGCHTHGGTINFSSVKKDGICRYKLTKENADTIMKEKRKSAESLIETIDKIFDDIEFIGGYLEGMENNIRANAINVIKYVSNKYLR